MSPEDDIPTTPRILEVDLAEMNDRNTWNGMHSPQNGHARNGTANVYHNGNDNLNGGSGGAHDHILSPLLQKDSTLADKAAIYSPSNNNEWKDSEGLNNLRNNMHKSHGNNNGSLMNGKNGIGADRLDEEDPLTGGAIKPKEQDSEPGCGIFGFRPKWARCFASTHMFMVVFLFAWVLQGMYLTYFVSVITTIEKLFQIKSKTTGMLMSAAEIGQISTAMLLTYFAGRGHRPRWIGVGMVLFAIATFGCSLPHFIFGEELMKSSAFTVNNGASTTRSELTPWGNASGPSLQYETHNLCFLSNDTKFGNDAECEDDVKVEQASHSKITVIVLCIFFVSLLSAGVGQTAVSTLGIPYIDDNVASRESPIYLAITVGVRILGPATGFIVGSICTRIYVNLSDPGFGPSDPRWISAWWLGPIMIGSLMMLSSIAMFSFPKQLRGNRIPPPEKTSVEDKQNLQVEEATPKLKDFPKTVKRQLKNDILMFRTASSVFHLLPIAGLYTFLPKYLETQFRLPAADANLISAFGGILVMGFGIVLSGIVILKFKPNARTVAAWIALTALIYSCGMAILMFVGCSMDDFAGLKINESTSLKSFNPTCSTNCSCDLTQFEPICGVDGRSYFSACHAGCSQSNRSNGNVLFSGCECITDFIGDSEKFTAVGGYCDSKCKSFVIFICLFAFLVFMHSTQEVGSILLIMRCTDPKDKAMAMGVIQSAIGIFGNVPCSILYGAIIDSACLIWKTICNQQGACSLYDSDVFRHYFLGMTASIMFLAFLMDLIVWKKAHRIDIAPVEAETPPETDYEKPAIRPESTV